MRFSCSAKPMVASSWRSEEPMVFAQFMNSGNNACSSTSSMYQNRLRFWVRE